MGACLTRVRAWSRDGLAAVLEQDKGRSRKRYEAGSSQVPCVLRRLLAFQVHLGEPDPALAGDGVEQIDPTIFFEDRGVTELVHRDIDGAAP